MNDTHKLAVVEEKDNSILDREIHARLLQDLSSIAEIARVPTTLMHQSMSLYCSEKEVAWVKTYRAHAAANQYGGLYMEGIPDPELRMQAMAAAFVRNFIDARVITTHELLDWCDQDDPPKPSVLLVPNFYTVMKGTPLTGWQVQTLYDALVARYVSGKQTVLYVESMAGLAKDYGQHFADFIKTRWLPEKVD